MTPSASASGSGSGGTSSATTEAHTVIPLDDDDDARAAEEALPRRSIARRTSHRHGSSMGGSGGGTVWDVLDEEGEGGEGIGLVSRNDEGDGDGDGEGQSYLASIMAQQHKPTAAPHAYPPRPPAPSVGGAGTRASALFESITPSERAWMWGSFGLVIALSLVAVLISYDVIDWPGDGIGDS